MSDAFVGTKIRMLREARRLARLDVQRLTGISEATLARAERAGILTQRTAEHLAPVLGCSVSDLLDAPGRG